jgi:hypothetical protein
MAEIFKLPSSSFEEIVKLIKAYSGEKEGVALSLDDVSQATGVPRTVVSGNNGFLVQIGIITDGNKKTATEAGRSLGRAYISKIDYEVERIWKEIVVENEFLNRMVSAVRIRNGMDRTSFINHLVYSSGQKDTKQNRTGASAIVEILKSVSILIDEDGKLSVNDSSIQEENELIDNSKHEIKENKNEKSVMTPQVITTSMGNIQININISCSVNELDELSDKLEKLLDKFGKNS